MQRLTVTFDGIDGPVEETHYFNLTETDFAGIIANDPDFFNQTRLKSLLARSVAATSDDKVLVQAEMATFIKDVVLHAHGTREGQQFYHIPENTIRFSQGLALNAVIQQILVSEDSLVDFFKTILPASIRDSFASAVAKQN